MPRSILILALLLVPAFLHAQPTTSTYTTEINQWHQERLDRLTTSTGWLTLVGLHPLAEGTNTLGSAVDSDVVMIAKAPASLGTITISESGIVFASHPEAKVFISGAEPSEPVTSINLDSDRSGAPTVLQSGPLNFFVIYRDGLWFLRVKDQESETLKNFQGIDRYPVSEQWRLEAKLEGGPQFTAVPNVLGQIAQAPSPGVLVFSVDGKEYRLTPQGEPGQSMFIVFGDATNGAETYGGGRFLTVDKPQSNGTVILDFNKSTNPPCVFSPYATCPLPSEDNILDLPVAAGEKVWGDHH